MTTLLFSAAFKRFLILLILMVFALLLLYTNYLQEINFFQNKLQLDEFQVDFNTYKLLQESNGLNQDQLKQITEKLQTEKNVNAAMSDKGSKTSNTKQDNQIIIQDDSGTTDMDNMQYFSLDPPFPNINLTSIGPVFIENGLIHLYCEYSFDTIRCTVGGRIPADKVYFPTAFFTNPNFEDIIISFSFKELTKVFEFHRGSDMNIGWIDHQILKSNIANIELFTNYIMLFGSNGTNMNLFNHPEGLLIDEDKTNDVESSLRISKKYKYYNFIHTQVCMLFILIYLKLINFILFGFTMIFHFAIHTPLYLFNCFKYEKHRDTLDLEKQEEEFNMAGFEEWIKNNELVEDRLLNNEADTLNIIKTRRRKEENSATTNALELRLRRESRESTESNYSYTAPGEGFSTGIEETMSMRLQDIRRLYNEDSPISNISDSPGIQSSLYLQSPLLTTYGNSGDNENNLTPLQETKVIPSSLNEFVDKYYLFYTLSCIFVLFHLFVYGCVNIGLYNMIFESFEVITTSDPTYLNMKNKSIFKIPAILVGATTYKNGSKRLFTHGNMIFDSLLNLLGCFVNFGLSILFHSIYILCMYTYTLSIY